MRQRPALLQLSSGSTPNVEQKDAAVDRAPKQQVDYCFGGMHRMRSKHRGHWRIPESRRPRRPLPGPIRP